jgi:hypothetical protein
MQQGRVTLDADWNELAAILERRLRAETVDIIGRAVVPKETPQGFAITIGGTGGTKQLRIGRGRMYVHGHLAESHGPSPLTFDLSTPRPDGTPAGVLVESLGAETTDYQLQPHWPAPAPLPAGNGPHLVYLDVWEREVTAIEDERLLEKALGGVDTTTRRQTVWQVRLRADVGAGVTCATPDAAIPGWVEATAPSAGRLSSRAEHVEAPSDPCLIPPTGGYAGLENQLYRVEIHTAGAPGTAAFKWSRDNATVATGVVEIVAPDVLAVVRTGRDAVLRINPDDWVEVTDDRRELAGLAGDMRKVLAVDDATQRITLGAALPADLIPSGAGDDTLARRHTRVRRWDQKGEVRAADGTLIVDLDAGTAGVIPVPAAGVWVALEKGVQVAFHREPAAGTFHVADYWSFAARTADASVEELDQAPPGGIHHHYARLAIVTFPDVVNDCRVLWPPDFGGEGCGCSVCVTPESHNGGTLTIQQAIDQVKATGGTVCLDAGEYLLGDTGILVDEAQSVRVVGQGPRTVLSYAGAGAALTLRRSAAVAVEALTLAIAARGDAGAGIAVRNCLAVGIERCFVLQVGTTDGRGPVAIGLGGYVLGAAIRDNLLVAGVGVAATPGTREGDARYLLTLDLAVEGNYVFSRAQGVSLEGLVLHGGETRLAGNWVAATGEAAAIAATGIVLRGSPFVVAGNVLAGGGGGIVAGTSVARIADNTIGRLATARAGGGDDGIVLAEGLDRAGIADAQVIGNRILDVRGRGIVLRRGPRVAMIKQNVIQGVGAEGILVEPEAEPDVLTVENNQLIDIAPELEGAPAPIAGMRLVRARQLQVTGNTVRNVAPRAAQSATRTAIDVAGCRTVRVAANTIAEVGPQEAIAGSASAGIRVAPPFGAAQVSGNSVRRSLDEPQFSRTDWYALRVEAPPVAAGGGAVTLPLLLEADQAVFAIDRLRIKLLARFPERQATVDGNDLVAWGGDAAVAHVVAAPSCIFTGNHCLLPVESPAPAVVRITAARIAAGNNIVRRPSDQDAVHLNVDPKQFTAVGNVTFGNVRLNGAALPAPWSALNVLSP